MAPAAVAPSLEAGTSDRLATAAELAAAALSGAIRALSGGAAAAAQGAGKRGSSTGGGDGGGDALVQEVLGDVCIEDLQQYLRLAGAGAAGDAAPLSEKDRARLACITRTVAAVSALPMALLALLYFALLCFILLCVVAY